MPVRKFRSVSEMTARKFRPLDPMNLEIACELTETSYALHPWRLEPGVFRFRSADERSRRREEALKGQVRRRS
jgi:hypothetical protein